MGMANLDGSTIATYSDYANRPPEPMPVRRPTVEENCLAGRHYLRRMRVGPTGRNTWMILVDRCGWCGFSVAVVERLTWAQQRWLDRSNWAIIGALQKFVGASGILQAVPVT